MKTTVNFLEAVKALKEGKCEKIQSVKARTTYSIDMDNNATLSLRLSDGHSNGINLRCESFLGEWELIGYRHKIVIENVRWKQTSDNSAVYPATLDSTDWHALLNKPKMKMTLEWVS